MIVKICPQSAGVILIRDGFGLNCGLRVLSFERQFISLSPQAVEVLYRIMCSKGWISAEEVVDWVYRGQRDGGASQALKEVNKHVVQLRRRTYRKFKACLPVRPTRTGYQFLDRDRSPPPPPRRGHSMEMAAA